MVGISDYRPIAVPSGAIELRVHGVSGTPPEGLIKDTPVLVAGTPTAGFYRHEPSQDALSPKTPGVREAYAWGGLTSGTRITSALRLLLLPFSLVNVAGWMVPGVKEEGGRRPVRPESSGFSEVAHGMVARLLALGLTATVSLGALWLTLVAAIRLVDYYHVTVAQSVEDQVRAALVAVGVLVLAWIRISRRRAKVPAGESMSRASADTLACAPVTAMADPEFDVTALWRVPLIRRRLSWLHIATALACAAWVAAAAVGGPPLRTSAVPWIACAALVLSAIGVATLSFDNPLANALARWVPWGAAALAVVAYGLMLWLRDTAIARDQIIAQADHFLADATAIIAIAVLVLVIAEICTGPLGGPFVGRLYAGAFTVFGFSAAFTGIAGLAAILGYFVPGTPASDGERATHGVAGDQLKGQVVTVAQLIAMVAVVAVSTLLIVVLLQLQVLNKMSSVTGFTRLRSTVAHARGAIVAAAAVFAAGAAAIVPYYFAQIRGSTLADPMEVTEGWSSIGWLMVAAVVAAAIFAKVPTTIGKIGVTIIGSTLVLAIAWGLACLGTWIFTDTTLHDAWTTIQDNSDTWFVYFSVTSIVVAPMAAVIVYIGWGSKDQGVRRSVGIFWDLVNFWPRQFHPWAPPPYTDTTIPELADRVTALAAMPGTTRVIVSAHSQGAIFALPAVRRIMTQREEEQRASYPSRSTPVVTDRIGLLTYGQLLDEHYRWLFPWIFTPALFSEVSDFLQGRWINLYRTTDPLGHPVRALGDQNRQIDHDPSAGVSLELDLGPTSRPKTLNHGDYWYTDSVFAAALKELA